MVLLETAVIKNYYDNDNCKDWGNEKNNYMYKTLDDLHSGMLTSQQCKVKQIQVYFQLHQLNLAEHL